jgi:hypothetical protein
MVSSMKLLSICSLSKYKPSTQAKSTITGIKERGVPDISHIVMFYWFKPLMYLDPVSKFQFTETTEWPGYFVEISSNVEGALKLKILKNDLVTVLYGNVVRSAANASHRNRRVSFKSDVQESLKLLDIKPSSSFAWKDSHHKHK